MKNQAVVAAGFIGFILITSSVSYAETLGRWDFNKNGNREGWYTPGQMIGAVAGGSVWISLKPADTDPTKVSGAGAQLVGNVALAPQHDDDASEGWTEPKIEMLRSPSGLNITTAGHLPLLVRVKILNLSPVTDLFVRWRGVGDISEVEGRNLVRQRRCAMKADVKQWQEITCFLDEKWHGTLDQVMLAVPKSVMRGDLWVDSVEMCASGKRA